MKKTIISLTVALLALSAVAQPPAAKLRKTVTTTIDTILIDVPHVATVTTVSDSAVLTRLDQLESHIKKSNDAVADKLNSIKRNMNSSSYAGNFVISALRHTVPLMPFIAAVFIVFFVLRYSYKRKVMNQELIIKYIDRGESVPEWLRTANTTRAAWEINQNNDQHENRPSDKNAKLFIVFTIILAAATFIWAIALVNVHGLYDILVTTATTGAFGYATVWCFQQYLKRN